ncbi:cytochrome P450 [Fomitopsis serialis]|uniref:cytochrome P450 n=1 Tax=Fomitopsis serialis TaxID=139415 RepID=UPI00200888FC|nr:cytochrome P450 [Neoantrodia serialis]KAH9934285.1 cytochrome P450 [Neoantrodia serialis]
MTNNRSPATSEAMWLFTIAFAVICIVLYRMTQPPPALRNVPRVPVSELLYSYVTGEGEDQRAKRVLLPFAVKMQVDVVLVWCFGHWMIHVVDSKAGKGFMENRSFKKQSPREETLLWHFTGRQNIFFSEGEQWKKHSKIFRAALQRTTPVGHFVALSRKLVSIIGDGGRVRWNDYTHRFTLDAVGKTTLGFDFEALDDPESPFVRLYHDVMASVSQPAFIFVPSLERWISRNGVRRKVDALLERFEELLTRKKREPGNDVITYFYDDADMTRKEIRDNVVVLFMAGHVSGISWQYYQRSHSSYQETTAGALSTLFYYMGCCTDVQQRARAEVLSVVQASEDLTLEHLGRMPFLSSVIREAMRLNNPSNITVPRIAAVPVQIGSILVPPGTPVTLNMYAVLHNERLWSDPCSFEPRRFLSQNAELDNDQHWMPFGHGPHQCPARNFAMMEQRTLAAVMLMEFEWEIPSDSIHLHGVRNAFSSFALNLPFDMDILFRRRREGIVRAN